MGRGIKKDALYYRVAHLKLPLITTTCQMQIKCKHPVIRKSHCMAVCSIRQFEWNII